MPLPLVLKYLHHQKTNYIHLPIKTLRITISYHIYFSKEFLQYFKNSGAQTSKVFNYFWLGEVQNLCTSLYGTTDVIFSKLLECCESTRDQRYDMNLYFPYFHFREYDFLPDFQFFVISLIIGTVTYSI